jgi:hypothetical protein
MLLGSVVVGCAATQLPAGGGLAGAIGTPPAYTATAAADGARLGMTVPNAPGTSTPIDGGGPSAQATVSSLGTSQAFASLPYPGDLPVRLPGLLAGVGVAGVPQYPFYASSDHPTTPDASLQAPGYSLRATSRDERSSAEAAAQAPDGNPASYRSGASVGPAGDGTIVATADSLARNLRIGDLVVGEAVSRAEARLAGHGEVERAAAFELTGVSIAGTAVNIGPDGVTVAGARTPLPGDSGVLAALAEHGITIAYIRPLETAHGVVAGGLRVAVTGTTPDGTRGTVMLTLGRATASVETAAGAHPSPATGVEIEPDPGLAPSSPAGDSGPNGEEVPGAGPSAPVVAAPALPSRTMGAAPGIARVPAPTSGPEVAVPGDGVAGPAASEAAPTLTRPDPIRRIAEPFDVAGFYPMLFVAAALAYAMAHIFRILGVK